MRRAISCVTWEPKSRMRILSWFMGRGRPRAAQGQGRRKNRGGPRVGNRRAAMGSSWCRPSGLEPVVGCFLGDAHVVNVRFAHAGGGDLDELGFGPHFVDRPATAV